MPVYRSFDQEALDDQYNVRAGIPDHLEVFARWKTESKRFRAEHTVREDLRYGNDAQQAYEMGLVNTVVPLAELEAETVKWCREMLALSPFALRLVKLSFHAEEDGMAGIQQLAHDANLLFYASDEAKEGREAYKAKRQPDFAQFPKRP